MSQRNIADLPLPPSVYRVDREAPHSDQVGFEGFHDCMDEDLRRVGGLLSSTERHSQAISDPHARELAGHLLEGVETGEGHWTPASSLYMRRKRIRVGGALWQLIEQHGLDRVRTFTIVPRTWEFTPTQLSRVDIRTLLSAFRTALYRKGAARLGGWLFVFVHGEFDPEAGVFRLHLHGICSLEMVPILDQLRTLPNYRTAIIRDGAGHSAVYRRVWISRQPLDNLPSPITYLMQSFWPSRAIYADADGNRRRVRQKRAIREPYHSMVLLWLDRWQLKDLALMVGLRVTRAGLIETRPRR